MATQWGQYYYDTYMVSEFKISMNKQSNLPKIFKQKSYRDGIKSNKSNFRLKCHAVDVIYI